MTLVDVSDLLARHVRESNLIEGIRARQGDPLYDNHLAAARLASSGKIIHPNELHAILGQGVPDLRGGLYRTEDVYVGYPQVQLPRPRHVPQLMEEWWNLVEQYRPMHENLEAASNVLHWMFLCIHPFIDGNGRTARLLWNMFRINKGLPWFIQDHASVDSYYAQIRSFEDGVFKKEYSDVY